MMKYVVIVLVVLLLVASGAAYTAGHWYVSEKEAHATTKAALEEQKAEVKEQKRLNDEMLAAAKAQTETAQQLIQAMRERDAQHQVEVRRINQQRASAQAALVAHPERFERIATFDLRRSMRDVCRGGAGSADTCRIEPVRPATAGADPAGEPDAEGDHPGDGGEVD